MNRIRRLPETVANQIAAGEVVERPASVVKELLENAVDAGARRIEIRIEDGGTGLVAITDDGEGMSPDDAVLCLERHATSKIEAAEDLTHVSTFGFRGEAIPSIASVSRFTLESRQRGSEAGVRVEVEGGVLRSVEACGAAPGTRVEVRDLFFNVPARRKFLKRPATELGHISEAVERVALAHPELAVRLLTDGRRSLDVPPATDTDPTGRIGRILGASLGEQLHALPEPADGPVRVRGWVGAPELAERTARGIRCFVNGRFVRDRTIQHAVQDAYRTLMERGRFPVVLLWIDVEPEGVDVNVHPQKIEVRFADSSAVHRAITRALGPVLAAQPWVPDLARAASTRGGASEPSGSAAPIPVDATSARAALLGLARRSGLGSLSATGGGATRGGGLDEYRQRMAGVVASAGLSRDGGGAWGAPASTGARVPAPLGGLASEPGASAPAEPAPAPRAVRFAGLRPVGQVLGTFLVCEGDGRMILIDQHAAHERVAFERMRRQHRRGRVEVQPLLVPRPLELEGSRARVAEAESGRLGEVGFELEPFGGSTWLLKSAPTALAGAEVERIVRDLLDELAELGASSSFDETIDAMLSCAACHTVVRAGDRLGREEIRALLEQMDEIDFGAHCPHGRPVYVEWSSTELGRLFHRS